MRVRLGPSVLQRTVQEFMKTLIDIISSYARALNFLTNPKPAKISDHNSSKKPKAGLFRTILNTANFYPMKTTRTGN